jgi:hypothetical protein
MYSTTRRFDLRTIRGWWLVVLLAQLVLSGCVKVEQTLTLDADGSGELAMRYGISEQTLAQLKAMEQLGGEGGATGQDSPFEFDPQVVRDEFEADRQPGVELVRVDSELVDGWKYIDLLVSFENIRVLKRTKLFKDSKLGIERLSTGNYRLTQAAGNDDMSAEDPSQRALMQQMAPMLEGLRIVQTIVAPSEIFQNNATQVDGRRASWVFDIAEDPAVIEKLGRTDLEMVISGEGIDLPTVVP